MSHSERVAVCSRSFSAHTILRQEIQKQFSHVTFNESGKTLQGQELVTFLKNHKMAIVGLEVIDDVLLDALPELKVIGKYGVGLDKLDFISMDRHNVMLGWTPGINALAVAELTVALALSVVRKIPNSNKLVISQQWGQVIGKQLSSMVVGVLGCGHVGKAVVRLLSGFGCKILAHDIREMNEFYSQYGVRSVGFEELLSSVDVLSLHIPKTSKTQNMLSKKNLSKMKSGAYLINTARGGLVDEGFVLEMLNSGQLLGAAFDVFEEEPPATRDLLLHPNFYSTSHIGGSSEEAILAMGRAAIKGLTEFRKASDYEF